MIQDEGVPSGDNLTTGGDPSSSGAVVVSIKIARSGLNLMLCKKRRINDVLFMFFQRNEVVLIEDGAGILEEPVPVTNIQRVMEGKKH